MANRPLRLGVLVLIVLGLTGRPSRAEGERVAQWDTFEVALKGPTEPNPYVGVMLSATFKHGATSIDAGGFYDGDGTYRVRFMPTEPGTWTYRTASSAPALDGQAGTFEATTAAAGVHGPVRVAETYHFAYADGTPFNPFGTTCYNWTHQPDALVAQTLASLRASPFNKVRMCVLPTSAAAGDAAPFAGTPPTDWDLTRFDPAFFRRFEARVCDLRDAGIDADVILFHPYEKTRGFDRMPADVDDRYVRYVVARLAAYRNVWWSMANEYDLIKAKGEGDFDRMLQLVAHDDPYHHLLSIHHSMRIFDNNKPYLTHASIQNGAAVEDPGRAEMYRDVWRKPVVYDEVKYEGNFNKRWGQLSGEEMTRRIWNGAVAGTYVGHGEVLRDDATQPMWTSAGGTLRGTSPPRIAFLKKVLADAPPIEPIDKWQDKQWGGKAGAYYLTYFGSESPREWHFALPSAGLAGGESFHVDVLDTWKMTVTPVVQTFTTRRRDQYSFDSVEPGLIRLPGRPFIALRITKVAGTTRPATTTAPLDQPD